MVSKPLRTTTNENVYIMGKKLLPVCLLPLNLFDIRRRMTSQVSVCCKTQNTNLFYLHKVSGYHLLLKFVIELRQE